MNPTFPERLLRYAVFPALMILFVMAGLVLLQRWNGFGIWDDAYMFTRYAAQFLSGGGLHWNVTSPPAYGLTTPAYLLVVLPALTLYPERPAQALVVASLVSTIVALGLLFLLVLFFAGATSRLQRGLLALWLAVALSAAWGDLSIHATSGMDTMLALAWITGFVICAIRMGKKENAARGEQFLLGLLGGAGIIVRPDALILAFALPMAWLGRSATRRMAYRVWASALLLLVFWMAGAYFYFGSALPLPFFAKNARVYGTEFYGYYELAGIEYLLAFVQAMWLPVLTLILGIFLARSRLRTVDRAALLGLAAFSAYHVLIVVPIMGFHWRFFVPALPLLLLPASRMALEMMRRVPASVREGILAHPAPVLLVPLALIPAWLNPQPLLRLTALQGPGSWQHWGQFDLEQLYQDGFARHWLHLDALASLPDTLVVATTEVGMVGMMHPNKSVIDLAGLNEPALAYGFDADRLLADPALRPDWIYMPFVHYEEMIRAIEAHPTFQQEYRYFRAEEIGANMGIAIHLKSPHTLAMLRILGVPR